MKKNTWHRLNLSCRDELLSSRWRTALLLIYSHTKQNNKKNEKIWTVFIDKVPLRDWSLYACWKPAKTECLSRIDTFILEQHIEPSYIYIFESLAILCIKTSSSSIRSSFSMLQIPHDRALKSVPYRKSAWNTFSLVPKTRFTSHMKSHIWQGSFFFRNELGAIDIT